MTDEIRRLKELADAAMSVQVSELYYANRDAWQRLAWDHRDALLSSSARCEVAVEALRQIIRHMETT